MLRVCLSDTALRPGCSTQRAGYAFSSHTKNGTAVKNLAISPFLTRVSLLPIPSFRFFSGYDSYLSCQNHTRTLREPLPNMSLYITPSQTSIFKPDVVDYLYFHAVTGPLQLKNSIFLFGQIKFMKEKGENKVATIML